MIALIRLSDKSIIKVFEADQPVAVELPDDAGTVFGATAGWSGGGELALDPYDNKKYAGAPRFGFIKVTRAAAPRGRRHIGEARYRFDGDAAIEEFDSEEIPAEPVPAPERPAIGKSVIIDRLSEDQIERAIKKLTAKQLEKWRAPDHPVIYCDDPILLETLNAIGADPKIVLAK